MRESYKVYDTDGSIIEDTESKRRFSKSKSKDRKQSSGGVRSKKGSRTEISTRIENTGSRLKNN